MQAPYALAPAKQPKMRWRIVRERRAAELLGGPTLAGKMAKEWDYNDKADLGRWTLEGQLRCPSVPQRECLFASNARAAIR